MNEVLTKKGQSALVKLVTIFEKLPVEKQYYLLGYAQSEADKNLQGKANE